MKTLLYHTLKSYLHLILFSNSTHWSSYLVKSHSLMPILLMNKMKIVISSNFNFSCMEHTTQTWMSVKKVAPTVEMIRGASTRGEVSSASTSLALSSTRKIPLQGFMSLPAFFRALKQIYID